MKFGSEGGKRERERESKGNVVKKTRDMIGGWRERVDERLRFIYVFEIIGTLGLFDFSNVALPLII